MRLHPAGKVLDSDLALEIADRIAAQALQQPQHPVLGKVFQLMGFRVELGLVVVVEHRCAHRHAGIDPAAGQDVDRGKVLCQPERIFQAERDYRRAQFDAACALRRGGHDRDGGRDARLQVPTPQPDAVEAERLGALDHRQRLLVPLSRIGLIEPADGQETDLAQRLSAFGHGSGCDGGGFGSRLQRLRNDVGHIGHRLDLQCLQHLCRHIVQVGLVALRNENR